jgi:bifunctional non-homologous end joining protein LigD
MLTLINPIERPEPFDHPDWLFEPKFDGFRAAADTIRGQLVSRNGNRMQRFEEVLDRLPKGHLFDGELVVLDDAGRPLFNELLFGRRRPTYVAFDLLLADGVDLRPLPLRERKAKLARVGKGAEGWIALTNGVVGEGRGLSRAVVEADLEGIVAKHLADAYHPKLARWHKILNRGYSQRRGRAEWFRESRRGRYVGHWLKTLADHDASL